MTLGWPGLGTQLWSMQSHSKGTVKVCRHLCLISYNGLNPQGGGYSDFCLLQELGLFFGVQKFEFGYFLGVKVLSTIFMGMPI